MPLADHVSSEECLLVCGPNHIRRSAWTSLPTAIIRGISRLPVKHGFDILWKIDLRDVAEQGNTVL